MKGIIFLFLFVFASNTFAQHFTAMTYNIRYENTYDGENSWENRKEKIANQLKFYNPDVIGFQEVLNSQLNYLSNSLDDYSYVGIGREDGRTKGEYAPIFYKKSKFDLIQSSTFWLSPFPDSVSVGWDAALNRICTWVKLKDKKTAKIIFVFNTHFDHIGIEARKNSALLLIKRINQLSKNNEGIILMGDFNSEPETEQIKLLSSEFVNTKTIATVVHGPSSTFNEFKYANLPNLEIDYIFVNKGRWKIRKYGVICESKNMLFYSDHFPIFVEMEIIK